MAKKENDKRYILNIIEKGEGQIQVDAEAHDISADALACGIASLVLTLKEYGIPGFAIKRRVKAIIKWEKENRKGEKNE